MIQWFLFYKNKGFWILIIIIMSFNFHTVANEQGLNFLYHYSKKEYDHHQQNLCFIQDQQGILYVGNAAGILEFDGVSWRVITIPNNNVFSMAKDKYNTIFVGVNNELGYLTTSPQGEHIYQSLLTHLPPKITQFGPVHQVLATTTGIYFRTSNYLFFWNYHTFTHWHSKTGFSAIYLYNNTIYVQQKKIGLQTLSNHTLHTLPQGSAFSNDLRKINMMVPYPQKKECFLIGTRLDKLYLYDQQTVSPFPTAVDDLLANCKLLNGIQLASGDFALATDEVGVLVISATGALKQHLNTSTGIMDNHVNQIYQEPTGNLWLALNNGITKIEYASPFTLYDQNTHLPGTIYNIIKNPQGYYYIGSERGLFTLLPNGQIQPLEPHVSGCFAFAALANRIVAATDKGLWEMTSQHATPITDMNKYTALEVSHAFPNSIWAALERQLKLLNYNEKTNSWTSTSITSEIGEILSMMETSDDLLWLTTKNQGVIALHWLNKGNWTLKNYTEGLPLTPLGKIGEIFVARFNDQAFFATHQGFYRFDATQQRFFPDTTLLDGTTRWQKPIFRFTQDPTGVLWFHSESVNYRAIRGNNGKYQVNTRELFRLPIVQTNSIYAETNAVWFCTSNQLIRYDKTWKAKPQNPFHVLLRRVIRLDNNNLLLGGAETQGKKQDHKEKTVYPYVSRKLRFCFAAPFFENEKATLYRFFLEGYDDKWSDWSYETHVDYKDLHEGNYSFQVQARNVFREESVPLEYCFKIQPPWYRSLWAYLVYLAAFCAAMWLFIRFRLKQLAKEKKHLEQLVAQRTQEITDKNAQLEEQTRQLQTQAVQLQEMDKVKSRFFATISHEFRTPLTLIMGPLEQIIKQATDETLQQRGQLMLRNAERLLGLINQLLDLARLDSGKMRLQVMRMNIVPFLRGILASFQLLAQQRQITLSCLTSGEDISLYFNPENLEQIMGNLLSNALKNTPPGGVITVHVATVAVSPLEVGSEGCLQVIVQDTGVGIPAAQLPHIFELFYQVQAPHISKNKGSGIGLALTRELVELHHGTIQVQSTEGAGCSFMIYLPLGKSHLQAAEIMDVCQFPIATLQHHPEPLPLNLEPPSITHFETEKEEPTNPQPIVLVVDDNSDLRRFLTAAFASAYQVEEAADGQEGWEKILTILPDIVIADVMMPRLDGFQLVNRIKVARQTSHIPVILLTAGTSHESILTGLHSGADDYITKPFSMELLAARVKNLINLRQQWQDRIKNQMALQPLEISISPLDEQFFTELKAVLEKRLSDPQFNVEELCDILVMGRTTLYRKILALTGETPLQFLRSYRLQRAAQLLKARAGTVSEIAHLTGFQKPSYFAHCFKEKFHVFPSDTTLGLPEDSLPLPVTSPSPLEKEQVVRDNELILIVEDTPDVADYLRDALEPFYDVDIASDGVQGFDLAIKLIPDLIISDIMMPGLDGFQLCQQLKQTIATSHIPIIFLTARVSERSIIEGFTGGVADYITKPFNTDIVLARIQNILRLRKNLQTQRTRPFRLEPEEITVSSMDQTFLAEIDHCITHHLADFAFNVEVLAEKCAIGRTTLYRKVLALTGLTPTHYIRSLRLHKAAKLLQNPALSITDVAFSVGFSSTPYFTLCFKEMFHRLPSQFSQTEGEKNSHP